MGAFLGLATVAILVLGLAVILWQEGPQTPAYGPTGGNTGQYLISEDDWGHVRAYDGLFEFSLGPITDQRGRYEVGFGRVVFTSAGIIVADDEHGKNAAQVQGGATAAGCLGHFQGNGVNVIIAVGKCVPAWATVTGDPQHRKAAEWIRIENARPVPVNVYLKYR